MKQYIFYILFTVNGFMSIGQEIYVVNNMNELKVVDSNTFMVIDLFAVDIYEFGYITDLAFAPDGSLFGVTNARTIISIDLVNETAQFLADLPERGTYTSLVCNSENELFTSKYLQLELYKYDIDSGLITFVTDGISAPGDFTFYQGNLIYPNIFNDFIKAWDGTTLTNVGCAVPLLYSFVNIVGDCGENQVLGIDENAVVYSYDLENETYEVIADLLLETGPLFGAATLSEYLASSCPLELLNEVECTLSTDEMEKPEILLDQTLVRDRLQIHGDLPPGSYYELWGITGELLKYGQLDRYIEIESLASGIYFIRVIEPKGRIQMLEKFIKQ